MVDVNVEKHGSASAAHAYLTFLFTDAAHEIFAKHGYRPINEPVLQRHQDRIAVFELGDLTPSVSAPAPYGRRYSCAG